MQVADFTVSKIFPTKFLESMKISPIFAQPLWGILVFPRPRREKIRRGLPHLPYIFCGYSNWNSAARCTAVLLWVTAESMRCEKNRFAFFKRVNMGARDPALSLRAGGRLPLPTLYTPQLCWKRPIGLTRLFLLGWPCALNAIRSLES